MIKSWYISLIIFKEEKKSLSVSSKYMNLIQDVKEQ